MNDRFLVVPSLETGEVKFKKMSIHDIGNPVSKFRLVIRHIGESDDS